MGSVPTKTFSTWLHAKHSKVRRSQSKREGMTRETIISELHFGHGDRGMDTKSGDDCTADMALPSTGGSTKNSQSP